MELLITNRYRSKHPLNRRTRVFGLISLIIGVALLSSSFRFPNVMMALVLVMPPSFIILTTSLLLPLIIITGGFTLCLGKEWGRTILGLCFLWLAGIFLWAMLAELPRAFDRPWKIAVEYAPWGMAGGVLCFGLLAAMAWRIGRNPSLSDEVEENDLATSKPRDQRDPQPGHSAGVYGVGILAFVVAIMLFIGRDQPQAEPPEPTLSLNEPCLPIENYAATVREHVETSLQGFQAHLDARPATGKYQELQKLFMSAHESIFACASRVAAADQKRSDYFLMSDPYLTNHMVAGTFEIMNKPWSDDDIQLFINGLNGADYYEDMSWLDKAMEQLPREDQVPCEQDATEESMKSE